MMNAKEYAEVLRSVIKIEIDNVRNDADYDLGDYEIMEGIEIGLLRALDKIDKSMFLINEKEEN